MSTIDPKEFRDSLSMIDKDGGRIALFPAEVKGYWRTRRNWVQAVLIVFFLVLPWTQINGTQTVLIDLTQRQFAFFGLKFWAHDGPLIFFFLGLAALGLFGFTAALGRVWCGWACPQTVFLDGVYRTIETWTEGGHLKRRALAKGPWNLEKVVRKSLKMILFFLVTFVITHSFLAYFVGASHLPAMITSAPSSNWASFVFILISMSLLFINFVWFREQTCLIVCPYGRFQSALHDKESVTVQYDSARGEPRKGAPVSDGQPKGACVSCSRCVQVCPTGIDIRNGIQLECIACTACIDACDEIMDKVHQPRGLIRYMNSSGTPIHWARPRILIYAILWILFAVGLGYNVFNRKEVDLTILRALDIPYFTKTVAETNESWTVNTYRIHIHNQTDHTMQIKVELADEADRERFKLQIADSALQLKVNEFKMIPFVIEGKTSNLQKGENPLRIRIHDQVVEVKFVGPNS